MKFKALLIFLPLLIVIAGCSTINYTEPQSGDLSRVRFSTNESDLVVIRAYETKECSGESEWMRLRNGVLLNSSPRSLEIPLGNYNKNAFKEFNVPAGSEKIIMFVGSSTIGSSVISCGVPLSLSFLEKDKDYELFYQMGLNTCSVIASEILKESSGQAVKKKLKIYSNSQEGLGAECMKQFKKTRLY